LSTGQVASLVVAALALAFYVYRSRFAFERKPVESPPPGNGTVRAGVQSGQ
ncbi:MAG: hypothetical protein H7Y38_11165, partial [Armatimonadetes bacterium]|nr:hypothetical protein [Armatimonadota bacterium]